MESSPVWRPSPCPESRRLIDYHLRPLEKTKGFRIALVKALHDASLRITGLRNTHIQQDELIRRAAGLHLLHESSLVLDDIMDHDVVRRGQRAVHCRYGRIPAACSAAWLCTFVSTQFIDQPAIMKAILDMGAEIAEAEILQWRARLYPRPTKIETWQQIALGDTGALFRLASRFAGLPSNTQYRPILDSLTYLYHGLDDIHDIEDAAADDGFAGGRDADLRDEIPTLMTCFTESKEPADLEAAVPQSRQWLNQFHQAKRQSELDVFFDVLKV